MKDFMTMYSNLVQNCFNDCINDFTSKAVSAKENSCVTNCATKFMKASERLGMRFQEANAAMMQGGGAPGK
ncbi:putative mitochondrial intermembrane space translocase subunit Tim9 [Ascodesmis nigricans]|uniref:Mitochondrial import inner membrane translocase subunit n=1 Tax=Ascodesmis nigricans TaxID=341454 RepID=A0A4S2N1N5_9PEZI|nr:putative mitochondrial intermembrane space translocase subunit Tim9 [Ascodesmis nigricans]